MHIIYAKTLEKDESEKGLPTVIQVMWIFGLMFATYTLIFAKIMISSLYGETWEDTDAGICLGLYGIYILQIGISGVMEAVDYAISPPEKLYWKTYSSSVSFV